MNKMTNEENYVRKQEVSKQDSKSALNQCKNSIKVE